MMISEVCIITSMPPADRSEKMTLRLTLEEADLRDSLARKLGIDRSGVMRQGLLKLAESEGLSLPEIKKNG